MNEYENTRRLCYGEEQGATFIPVCERCSRYVKANSVMFFNGLGQLKDEPNATCTRCGPTKMLFVGYH